MIDIFLNVLAIIGIILGSLVILFLLVIALMFIIGITIAIKENMK